ncbi:MAG: DNA-3-methyladenine glycosylase [Propionibacteriaceae bacterium]
MSPDLSRPAPEVAPFVLGAILQHGPVAVRITEVEAYDGADDPASHAWKGQTARNAVMFGPPGHAYVYFSYGMHWAINMVCGPAGTASGVLLRAGAVLTGVEVARSRRGGVPDGRLARGPACLTQALGITSDQAGVDLFAEAGAEPDSGPRLVLAPVAGELISRGPRVGVSRAADRPCRFWLTDEPSVSSYKRSPRAPAVGAPDSL